MTFEELLSLLSETVSGVRAKDAVRRIASFHRVQASPGYDDAIAYLRGQLEDVGIPSAVHAFRADGRSRTYTTWVSPPAWTMQSARLLQIEPTQQVLGTYADCRQLVVVHSPAGGIDAAVVHVGGGDREEDYEGVDVRGKIVLASGRPSGVSKQAGPRGAVGLVFYPSSERAAASYDLVQYASFFPHAEEIPDLVPSFCVSRRVADRLLKQLRTGQVRLRGEIDAAFVDDGSLQVLEAWVPGIDQDDGEVLLVAHVCHPQESANDNASGSAVLLELARTFQELRHTVALQSTVRFLWVPEFYGTLPWSVANEDALRHVHFVLNLDMVGQSPDLIGEPLCLFRATNVTPTYLNACIEPIARAVAARRVVVPGQSQRPLHWEAVVPSGGSDHLVFGSAPHNLPTVMMGHDDPYWHTSLDTIEKVDASRLKQVALVAALLAAVPSMIDEASRLPDWLLDYSVQRLTTAHRLAKGASPTAGRRLLELACEIEEERIESLADLSWSDARTGDVRGLLEALHTVCDWLASSLANVGEVVAEPEVDRPVRTTDGPLPYTVTESLDEEEKQFFDKVLGANHRGVAGCLFDLCDGTRTIEDLALWLTLDFERPFAVDDVRRGIALFRKARCVEPRGDERR